MDSLAKVTGTGAAIASAFLLVSGREAYDFAYLTDASTACIAVQGDPLLGFLPQTQVDEVRQTCSQMAQALVRLAPTSAPALFLLGQDAESRLAAPRDAWLAAARLANGLPDDADAQTLAQSVTYAGLFASLYQSRADLRPLLAAAAGRS